ncbi:DUF1972 domain-containing protein [Niallia taxi]|uniref:beta 1-4 rhamnosyltransferase Cps2T n=1 Tax=Niallia taxi TaxID=2499688 RepID=UPI003982CD10
MKNIFIIGSKGIPAKYGGFETFVENLTIKKRNSEIKYHVACISSEKEGEFEYNNARCFYVKTPNIGSAGAVLYDLLSLKKSINYIKNEKIENPIIYILTCRIGPFIQLFKRDLKKLGIKLITNPDGHEWKRSKWNNAIKKYWKYSENKTIKHVDYVICDSKSIERYIVEEYKAYAPRTEFIPYGADIKHSILQNNAKELVDFNDKFGIKSNDYYLIVGRFVPENNYALMITEFMKSKTKKDLVIITNVEENKHYHDLLEKTQFTKDNRIKFVGTVYNEELLKKIRENAYGYIHGHEVGGTNPSLLEALASTPLNLLLDVNFNSEVGESAALYFSKEVNSLSNLINTLDNLDNNVIAEYAEKAKIRIAEEYSWEQVINNYEIVFTKVDI